MKIEFEDISTIEDSLFTFAVILSRYKGQWIYCKHRDRNTWEIPGGRREPGEKIIDTAKRELYEESGAVDFTITPVCAYSVVDDIKSYGILCFAEVDTLGPLPPMEIELIRLFDDEPEALTYPLVQPSL